MICRGKYYQLISVNFTAMTPLRLLYCKSIIYQNIKQENTDVRCNVYMVELRELSFNLDFE